MTSPGPGTVAVVLDSTALSALGTGNRWLSRLVVAAAGRTDTHVFAPALCLAAAVAERPLLADHIGGLSAIQIRDLTYTDAAGTGLLIREGADWRHAHAVAAARPSLDWPDGLPIVTKSPQAYAEHDKVSLIPLD